MATGCVWLRPGQMLNERATAAFLVGDGSDGGSSPSTDFSLASVGRPWPVRGTDLPLASVAREKGERTLPLPSPHGERTLLLVARSEKSVSRGESVVSSPAKRFGLCEARRGG